MRRGVHPFSRAISLIVGFGLVFGGFTAGGVMLAVTGELGINFALACFAFVLGSAWVYDDLLDPMEDRIAFPGQAETDAAADVVEPGENPPHSPQQSIAEVKRPRLTVRAE